MRYFQAADHVISEYSYDTIFPGTARINVRKRKKRARAVDQYITMRDGDPVEVIYNQNNTQSGGM